MIRARQEQKIQHGRADQELFVCPSQAAKMEPGHAVCGEQTNWMEAEDGKVRLCKQDYMQYNLQNFLSYT